MQTNPFNSQTSPSKEAIATSQAPQFVDGKTLLKLVFPSECRPTLRWLRERQKRREIPYIKLGRLVFFNPDQVKEALAKQSTAIRR